MSYDPYNTYDPFGIYKNEEEDLSPLLPKQSYTDSVSLYNDSPSSFDLSLSPDNTDLYAPTSVDTTSAINGTSFPALEIANPATKNEINSVLSRASDENLRDILKKNLTTIDSQIAEAKDTAYGKAKPLSSGEVFGRIFTSVLPMIIGAGLRGKRGGLVGAQTALTAESNLAKQSDEEDKQNREAARIELSKLGAERNAITRAALQYRSPEEIAAANRLKLNNEKELIDAKAQANAEARVKYGSPNTTGLTEDQIALINGERSPRAGDDPDLIKLAATRQNTDAKQRYADIREFGDQKWKERLRIDDPKSIFQIADPKRKLFLPDKDTENILSQARTATSALRSIKDAQNAFNKLDTLINTVGIDDANSEEVGRALHQIAFSRKTIMDAYLSGSILNKGAVTDKKMSEIEELLVPPPLTPGNAGIQTLRDYITQSKSLRTAKLGEISNNISNTLQDSAATLGLSVNFGNLYNNSNFNITTSNNNAPMSDPSLLKKQIQGIGAGASSKASVPQRLPNETIADYKARVGM